MIKSALAYLAAAGLPEWSQPPPGWRRLFHAVAGSSIPVAGIFAPVEFMVAALAVMSGGGLVLDVTRFRIPWVNRRFLYWLAPLLKDGERRRFTGATFMVIGALFSFLLFGPQVAVPALLFLSLGDPAAALAGRRLPGPRIRGKSPGGTAAFILVSLAVTAALTGSGAIDYHWGLWIGAVVAGVVELASLPPDDNLSIPLIAGATMYFLGV